MASQEGLKIPKDLVVPSSVDALTGIAFAFRPELESVVIHKNVTKVSGVFDDCPNLKSITFEGGPNSKLTFFSGVRNCPSLSEIVVPDGVTKIEAFRGCTGLRSVTLPDSVKEMDYSTFVGCTRLQYVRLSNGLEKIPSTAFKDCTSLKSLTIPNSVTTIGDMAFAYCPALESIYIPSSVTEIEKSVFIGVTPFYESPNVVIYTEPGSYIESYAKEHNIKVVTSGMPTPTPKPTVSTTPSAWAQAEVTEATQAGLVPSDMLSSYTSAINREEFCRLMVKLIEAKSGKYIADYIASQGKKASAPFMDTTSQQIIAAYTLGIVNGVSGSSFNPSGTITRQEAAAMLERTAKVLGIASSGSGVSFSDNGKIASWATGSVAFVSGLTDPATGGAVMGGVGNGNFGPTGTYTREQAIATTLRLFHCAT